MDSDFKLHNQISSVTRSCFYQLRRLAKVKPFLSQQHFQTVIHAYITSRLDYCNSLYFGASQKELARLQLVQNAAARLLTGTKKFDHITPVLRSRHWLPVHLRIRFKILVFTFKSLNGQAPPYLSDLVNPYTPARCLRSANQMRLQGPKAKKDPRGKRAFSAAAPTLWNELPMPVKQAPSLPAFKARLKTHFFLLAFGQ